MKIKTNIRPLASVMVLTFLMAFVIGTALGAYLLFVSQQNLDVKKIARMLAIQGGANFPAVEVLDRQPISCYKRFN